MRIMLMHGIIKGMRFVISDRYTESIECYDKALEIDEKNISAWDGKGLALEYHGTIECFDKAVEIDEKCVDAWYNKGLIS